MPDRPLEPGINRFEVRVSEAGDTWIERLQVLNGLLIEGAVVRRVVAVKAHDRAQLL